MSVEARGLWIRAFAAPRELATAAWGRQVSTHLYERLTSASGLRPRLVLDPRAHGVVDAAVLGGSVEAGSVVRLEARLVGGRGSAVLLDRDEKFPFEELFERLDRLAADVAVALGASPLPARTHPATASFPALRDYMRAIDLTEETDLPLDLEDRRRKLEWLLLSVEADPAFRPAADALLEAGIRAHGKGLIGESRRALELLARLAPQDARAWFALGELACVRGAYDEARSHFERCVSRDPSHREAHFRLALMADEEGDRDGARRHLEAAAAGAGGRVEALLLLGIICAEDGDRDAARAAWTRAAEVDPLGCPGLQSALEATRRLRRRRTPRR